MFPSGNYLAMSTSMENELITLSTTLKRLLYMVIS